MPYRLTLKHPAEAEIATEFGDGTLFRQGDVVWHDPAKGRFWKTQETKS
jgi:hypothetical protein